MDLNLLESERVDRYVLEVFVGKLNFTKACNAQALNNNANKKDKSKVSRLYLLKRSTFFIYSFFFITFDYLYCYAVKLGGGRRLG